MNLENIGRTSAKMGLLLFVLAFIGFVFLIFNILLQLIIIAPLTFVLGAIGLGQLLTVVVQFINIFLSIVPWIFGLLTILAFLISYIAATVEIFQLKDKVSTVWKVVWIACFFFSLQWFCSLYYYFYWRGKLVQEGPKTVPSQPKPKKKTKKEVKKVKIKKRKKK